MEECYALGQKEVLKFHFHENPNQKCPVGKNIHQVLDKRLLDVQKAMEEKLSEMTLADMKIDIEELTKDE